MPSTRLQRRGYVLVLTLGLLALAAISLAGLARYSLGLAATSRSATEDLQRRWGLASVRHVLWERADEILDGQVPPDQAAAPPWPKPASLFVSFRLGGQKFEVLVADEDAKVDLNTIHARKPDRLLSALRHLSQEGLTARLVPQRDNRAAFSSWGQVFDLARLPAERDVATALIGASREVTCWGSGRLNLRRASDAAVRETAGVVLSAGEVSELVQHRQNWGGEDVKVLLAQLGLRQGKLAALSRLVGTESRNYSLWITISNGHRTWPYQYVNEAGPVCFAW